MLTFANIKKRIARAWSALWNDASEPARASVHVAPHELVWDSGCASVVIDARRVPFLSVSLPDVSESGAGHVVAEMLLTDYVQHMLPMMPNSGGLPSFVMVITVRHPSITGGYSMMLDDCTIATVGGPHLGDGGLRALRKTLQIQAQRVFECGASGGWKSVAKLAPLTKTTGGDIPAPTQDATN